jgi:hypothetical protein
MLVDRLPDVERLNITFAESLQGCVTVESGVGQLDRIPIPTMMRLAYVVMEIESERK